MKAVLCPVCGGSGEVADKHNKAATTTCHGCGGKGWVEVQDDNPPTYVPYYPPYTPPEPWYPTYPNPYQPWCITTTYYT